MGELVIKTLAGLKQYVAHVILAWPYALWLT